MPVDAGRFSLGALTLIGSLRLVSRVGVAVSARPSVSRFSQRVFDHGTLIPGRALWVGLELEGSRIGVLNIYAPTDPWCRATFWRTLMELLPVMDSWIVGRDFNNLETMEDQQGKGTEFAGIAQAE